jgi:hypothetical protein
MADSGSENRRSRTIIAAVLALLVGVAGGALIWSVTDGGDGDDQPAGEIILAAAADVGPDPWTPDPMASAPDPALAQPAVASDPVTSEAGQTLTATAGGTEGLYGGTQDKAACDAQKMVDFLAENPDKAAAWVAALNADPDVAMPDGSDLTVAKIPDYVATLTPLVLREDTRVTNHGFKAGKPTPLQSVLQKGSAVLVDDKGVPRTKCFCANPLLPPVASSKAPTYVGDRWPDFDPGKVSVIQANPTPITSFVVTDLATGRPFTLTPGSTIVPPASGTTTTTAPAATTTDAPTTTAPGTTAAPTTAPPASGPSGTYPVTVQVTECQTNGGTCNTDPSPSDIVFTCSSATTCTAEIDGAPRTFTVSGSTLTHRGPYTQDPFVCGDGTASTTTIEATFTVAADGSLSGQIATDGDPTPPSCPDPFRVVRQVSAR